MKKKSVSIILAVILLMTQFGVFAKDYSDYPQRFWDVPKDHWAFTYIAELVDKGVLAGYEDGSFRPDNTVTRAEWAKIMVLAAGLPLVYGFETPDRYFDSHFWDMHDHWANPYVNAAEDYLTGYADGTFKPDQAAVREDVTVSMVKLKGYDISKVDYSYLSRFSDMNSISNSLKAYVAVAVEKELIDGFEDGTFRGQDTLTRAEAATLLWRAFQYGNDNKVVDTPTSTPTLTPTQKPEEVKPIETPEPTGEPDTTPKPTDEPEVPDEPEASSEPESNQKPYKVDTLVKFDDFVDYVIDDNDSVYYTDGKKVMKVDVYSKNEEEILATKDLTIDTDEYTLDDFNILSICYDKYRDRLLVQGYYEEVNSAKEMNNQYLYEVKNGDFAVVTDNFIGEYGNYLVGILSNGDYVVSSKAKRNQYSDSSSHSAIIDCNNFSEKSSLKGSVQVLEESDDNLYYYAYDIPHGDGANSDAALCEYDYVHTSFILNNSGVSNIENRHFGLSNEYFVTTDSDNSGSYIRFYNFKGKQLKEITNNDYVVKDKSTVIWSSWKTNIFPKLLLTDNGDIIFYDESAKTIRMISEND